MSWLAENSFHPMMCSLVAAMACGVFGLMLKKKFLYALAVLLVILAIAFVSIERYLVTDREKMMSEIYDIASALRSNDVDSTAGYINPGNRELVNEVRSEMPLIDFQSVVVSGLDDPVIDLESKPPRATMSFNIKITADAKESERFHHSKGTDVARATLTYVRDDAGNWKIDDYDFRRIQLSDFTKNW